MPDVVWQRVLEQLRTGAGQTDAQLLEAFVARGEQSAFECLVWRHAALVQGVCRRILTHEADADDAFQATFLVLFQKAPTLKPPVVLAGWLYQVAQNVARKARTARTRRQFKEAAYVRPTARFDPELAELLDVEVQRLPWKYRVPVLLCELEGRPLATTAAELGWPQGTLASRLARGKMLLAKRLARCGLPAAALVPTVVSERLLAATLTSCATPTPALQELAQGVLPMLTVPRWSFVAVAAVLALGVGYVVSGSPKETPTPPSTPIPKATLVERGPMPREILDTTRVLGRWRVRPRLSQFPNDAPAYAMFEFIQQEHQGLLIASTEDLKTVHWYSWVLDPKTKTVDFHARVEGVAIPNQGRYFFNDTFLTLGLNVPLTFNGNPGDHERPTPTRLKVLYTLEREQVAWGETKGNLQFGLATEPHGLKQAVVGSQLSFRIYVRNVSNDGVDVHVNRTDGNPRGWDGEVIDNAGTSHLVPGPVGIPGVPQMPTILKTRLTSYGVAHVGDVTIWFRDSKSLSPSIWPEGIVTLPAQTLAVQYRTGYGANRRSTGQLTLALVEKK